MPFVKGMQRHPNAGRKPGIPNKTTINIREAFDFAFNEIGGAKAFAKWAHENPGTFYQLYSKMLPTNSNTTVTITRESLLQEVEDRMSGMPEIYQSQVLN